MAKKKNTGMYFNNKMRGEQPSSSYFNDNMRGVRPANTDYSSTSLAEIDRKNREESMRQARMKAIEIARTKPIEANAGNDRTTALRQNTNPYGLPVYKGLNTAENGADVDPSRYMTDAIAQTPTVSEEESFRNAEKRVNEYLKNDELKGILDNYARVSYAKKMAESTSGLKLYKPLNKLMFGNELDKYKQEFIEKTGVDEEEFDDIAEHYNYYANAKAAKAMEKDIDDMSLTSKLAMSPLVALEDVTGNALGVIAAGSSKTNAKDLGRDYNSAAFGFKNFGNAVKKSVEKDISGYYDEEGNRVEGLVDEEKHPLLNEISTHAYEIPIMTGESVISAMYPGNVGTAMYASGAYADSLKDNENRGLTEEQAIKHAAIMGTAEYIFERTPLAHLGEILKKGVGKQSVKSLIMRQMREEGQEELGGNIVDVIADAFISGDKSKLNQTIALYQSQEWADEYNNGIPLTKEEATIRAWKEWGLNTLDEYVTAALSAGLSVGLATGPSYAAETYSKTKAGRNIANYENKTGNLTRNVENEAYIPDTRESYVADQDYEQAQETRQAILAASEKAAKGEKISGKEARALAVSYSKTAENLRTAQKVEGTKIIENAKAKAEEKAVEAVKEATTPTELEIIKEENINSEVVRAAVEEKKAEMIEAGEATEKDFTEAITPTKAATMAENGETIAPEVLEQLPEKVKQAYETGNADQANKLTSAASKADINSIRFINKEGETIQSEIKSVSQNNSGELVLELSNGESVKAAEAQFSDKGKYIYNSPNGINSLDNPVLAQIAFDIEKNSKHGVAIGYVTNSLKDMYTIGASGLDFDQAIKSKKYDVSTLGKDMLKAAYEEGKKHSGATSRATAAKKGKGLIREVTEENSADYKRQFADEATQNEYENQLSESNKKFLELFSRKIGVDIAFFNENSQDRGSYRPDEGKIYLNLFHSHNMFNVALHEGIGEFMAASNEKAYNAIVDSVLNAYAATNSTKLAKDIRAYQSAYEGDTYGGTYRGAAQELFNDVLSDMFSSEENMKKLYNWMLENEGEQQANKVKKTLADYFKSVAETIKEVITEGRLSKAEVRQLRISEKEANTYVDQILRAMDVAIANRDNSLYNNSGNTKVRNSLKLQGIEGYTEKEIENLTKGGNIIIAESLDEIEDYVINYVGTNQKKKIYLGKIGKNLAARIKADTGVDIEGYHIAITNAFENSHADAKAEALQGQIAITPEIIKLVPQIIAEYDSVVKDIRRNGQVGLKFEKDINGKKTIIEYVSGGRHYIYLQTMYGRNSKNVDIKKQALTERSNDTRSKLTTSETYTDMGISNSSITSKSKNATTSEDKNNNKNVQNIQNTVRHSFAGINSETADKEQLKKAQELQRKGMGDLTILETTGWFLGMDNQWKYEIPDNDIEIFKEGNREYVKNNPDFARYLELENKILFTDSEYTEEEYDELLKLDEIVSSDEYYKTKRYGKLSDYIQHDELFRSYPWMQNVDVMFVPMESDKEKGYADPQDLVIALNIKFQTNAGWNKDALKSTLLHEIQHIIQAQEGFAGGSTPEWWANIRDERIERDKKNIEGAKEHLQKWVDKAAENGNPTSTGEFVTQSVNRVADKNDSYDMEDHWAAVAEWKATSSIYYYENMISKLERHIDRLLSESDIELYYNTAGEIEARDTANRANWTKEQRLKTFPVQNAKDVVYPKENITNRRYSIQIDTEGRSLSEGQQEYFKDSKVVDDKGRLKVVYHGTQEEFYAFNPVEKGGKNGRAEGYGIYFAENQEITNAYGDRQLEGYLNMRKPAYDNKKTIKAKDLAKLIEATCKKEAKQLLEDGGYDSLSEAIKDTWVSNVVYTYDKPMKQAYLEAAQIEIDHSQSDMSIIQGLMNDTGVYDYGDAYEFYEQLKEVLGFDGYITDWVSPNGDINRVYVAFDSNQFKFANNLNPTDNPDIRKSYKVDNQSRDVAPGMQQYLSDNADVFFDKNGAIKNYYHGSRYAGFTAFSLDKMDDERSIFLTDNEGVAKTYAGTSEKFEPDRKWSFKELENAISLYTGGDWEVEKNDNGIVITESGFIGEEGTKTTFNSVKEAQDYLVDWIQEQDIAENGGVYNVYIHSTNPLVIDARNQRWDEIEPWEYDRHLVDVNITRDDDVYEVDYANVEGEYFHETYNSREEFEENFSVLPEDYDIPDEGEYYEDLYLDKNKNIIPSNTRAMSAYAKENGYDSLVINNVVDSGLFGSTSEQNLTSQVVVVFDPNQVKSVYNQNPTASEDIRYSKSVDSDGNKLSVQQKEMFKDSKAVDKDGNLLVLYHGSQSADRFNTFDMNARGIVNGRAFGDGFYFTPYQDVADFWGEKNLYKVYLNLINPYYANKSSKVPKDVKKLIKDRYKKSLSSKRDVNGAYRTEVKNAYDALEVLWRYGKINDLKTLGYDGVIFNDKDVEKYSVQYVAFNPEQIKETTNLNPTKDTKDIRYSVAVGEDRIHTYKGIEIIQNPSNKEYQQMRADIIKERPWLDGPDTILLRHTYDEEGNEYYWDAYAGMHFEIEPVIAEHWKTRVNQQWEWWKNDDKDFWANRSFRRYSKAVFGEESQYSSQLEQTQFVSQILSTLNNQLKGTTVSMKYIDETVKYILDKYDADLNPDDFKMELSQFIAYMTANEQVDYNQMMNYLLNVGDEVIQASRLKDPEEERIYSELKKELSSHKINLTEQERKELISKYGGSWNAVFGRLNAAGIKLNNAGQHMDGSTYAEIVDKFRTIAGVQLDEETTAVDQIATILDAMEVLKPSAYQWEGATDMDKALDVATTIIDRYYSMATAIKESNIVKGTEKGAAAVERAKKSEIKKLRAKQEEYKAKINEEFQQLVEDRKKVIQEQQEFYKRQAEIEKKFKGEKREFDRRTNMSAKELEKTARLQAQVAYQGLKDTEAKKKNKDNIVRTCMRLINWMNKPTDTRHVPTFLKPALSDMIKSINFMPASMRKGDDGTISAIKWQESMRKLQQVLQGISNADAESLNDSDKYELSLVMEVDEIVNKMQQLLDKYGGTADISRMKAEDLKTLSDIMTSISKGISQMNENFMNRRFKHVSEAAKASMKEMNELKPISDTALNAKDWTDDFLNLSMLEPISFFEEMGEASESIMQEFFDGEKIGIEIIEEADKFFDKLADDLKLTTKEIRAWENDAKEYKFGGVPITLTSADLMSLYCSYNREKLDQEERPFEATHHIAAGGIKGFRHKIGYKTVNRNPQVAHVNEAEVLRLLDNLTETQKQYADMVVKYMSTTLAEHGNKTSNKLNGYSKFLGKYYFPLKTDNNAIATTESNNTSDQAAFRRLIFPSFTKSQIDKADNALVIMNFFDVVTEHITGMSNYCAYAMPISDAMRWYNYAETERANTEVEDQYQRYTISVKGSMDRVRGNGARKYFENFIRDVNLNSVDMGDDKAQIAAQTLTGLAKAKAVGLNIRVILQQPCAIIRAKDVIEGKYLALGWAKMTGGTRIGSNPDAIIPIVNKQVEYAQSKSYLCYWKSKGLSDTRISQGMKEIITGQDTIMHSIVERTGYFAGAADDITWAAMYLAAEEKIKATTNLEYATEEFDRAVEELFSDIINHTQVIDSQLRKTATMRSKNWATIVMNAFKKEPQKSYNMLHRARWNQLQAHYSGDKDKIHHADLAMYKTLRVFIESSIVTAILQSLPDAWRDDDDDEFWKKFLRKMLPYESKEAIIEFTEELKKDKESRKPIIKLVWNLMQGVFGGTGNIIENADLLSSMPGISDIVSGLKGYKVQRLDDTALLSQVNDTINQLGSSTATPYSIMYSLSKLLGYFTGVGADNALRDLRGIYNQFISGFTGKKIAKSTKDVQDNKKTTNLNALQDAFDNGGVSDVYAAADAIFEMKQEEYMKAGKDEKYIQTEGKEQARNIITREYKPIYKQLVESNKLDEAVALETNLVYAYSRLGWDAKTARANIKKWLKD